MVQEAFVAVIGNNLVPEQRRTHARGLKTGFFTGDELGSRCAWRSGAVPAAARTGAQHEGRRAFKPIDRHIW